AEGEPAPSVSASTSSSANDLEARREGAKTHFLAGIERMKTESWDAALAEFEAGIALYPTSNTRKNAAICLTKLARYDEALAQWQLRLKEFGPQMPPAEFDQTTKAILDLKPLVGEIKLVANVDGAKIVVDGRERGFTPMASPITVNAGTRYVRVVKEGYAPFEAKPSIAGKSTVEIDARLEQLVRAGKLRVIEEGGAVAEVVVDGVAVGKTPNETVVSPGVHSVQLRGEGILGTQPVTAKVDVDQVAVLRLKLVELPCELRIEPTPPNATIALDGVPLGQGVWDGRVTAGAHKIEIGAEGYLGSTRSLATTKGAREVIKVALDRDEGSPLWSQGPKWRGSLAAYGGFALGASLGGEYERSCGSTADCYHRGRPVGFFGVLRGGWDLSPRVTLEGSLGYLRMTMNVARKLDVQAEGGSVPGDLHDYVVFGGPFLGVGAAYAIVREPVRVSVAITLGAQLVRSLTDRDGTVQTDAPPSPRPLFSATSDAVIALVPLVIPEVRVAWPLTERFSIGGSLSAIIGFADVRPNVSQAAVPSNADKDASGPTNPQWQGKYIGFVPRQGSKPESDMGTFAVGGLSVFGRVVF
ncbi:MAG: PEGA domain-containing protein, partial [Polyangiales bacterium]